MKAAVITLAAVIILIVIAAIWRNNSVRKFRANLRPGIYCHYYVNEEKYYGKIINVYADENILLIRSETGVYSYVNVNNIYP